MHGTWTFIKILYIDSLITLASFQASRLVEFDIEICPGKYEYIFIVNIDAIVFCTIGYPELNIL